jgi:WD40 repeat protein
MQGKSAVSKKKHFILFVLLLTGSSAQLAYAQENPTGPQIVIQDRDFSDVSSFALSPDGRRAACGSVFSNLVTFWDITSGQMIRSWPLGIGAGNVSSIAFSSDGRTLLLCRTGRAELWDVATGQMTREFRHEDGAVKAAALSPDGRTVCTGGSDGTLKLWNAETGDAIYTLAGHTKSVESVTFSSDGQKLVSGSMDATVRLWEASTGNLIRTFKEKSTFSFVHSVAISLDGRTIASGLHDKEVSLWDAETGQKSRSLSTPWILAHVAFSPDGHTLLSSSTGSGDRQVILWDVKTGGQIYSISPGGDGPPVAFSRDGKALLTGGESAIELWDGTAGRLRYSMATNGDGEWFSWTPEGFFSGTDWATHTLVHIVDKLKWISINQVYNVYYRPDLVAAKAAGKDISSYSRGLDLENLLHGARGGLPPSVEILSPKSGKSAGRDVQVQVRVTDQGGGVGRITVFNGDSPVVLSDGGTGRGLVVVTAPFTGGGHVYQALLSLRGGTNVVSVSAYNTSNTIESARVSIQLVYESTVVTKPDLYILAVAVTQYRDGNLRLKYPVEDAAALAAAMQKQEGGLYKSVHISALYDEKATRDGLAAAFDEMASIVESDDVFVLYFVGHGVTYDKDGEYYFLPVDFRYTDSSSISAQGISKDDITRGVAEIKAQKSVLLFDTCDSGSFIETPAGRGIEEKTAVDRLARAVGRATIVASSRNELALEGYKNHGVFTYALLQGLSGAADEQNHGYVSVKGLSAYVENEVPDLTYKMAGYEQIPQSLMPVEDFPFAKH